MENSIENFAYFLQTSVALYVGPERTQSKENSIENSVGISTENFVDACSEFVRALSNSIDIINSLQSFL